MFDDLDPPKKLPELVFRKLDALSVTALESYIEELKAEIVRAQEEIKKRSSARDKAETFFKKTEEES